MAISGSAIWEVRTTGTASNANGGFFVAGSGRIDYSQQDPAQYNLTSVTTLAADATLLTASAAVDMVGNGAHIIGTSNFIAGYYEVLSVVAGVSITLDRTCTTAGAVNGTVNIGGALSLGSNDDQVFESMTPGNVAHVKAGTYTLGGTVSMAANGNSNLPIIVQGYNATRNDNPVDAQAPLFNPGAAVFTTGNDWDFKSINFTGTAASVLTLGSRSKLIRSRVLNNSQTPGRAAVTGATDSFIWRCNLQSYKGTAFTNAGNNVTIDSCYVHDSNIGLTHSAAGSFYSFNNIFRNFATTALNYTGATVNTVDIKQNTLIGCNQTGTGIAFGSGIIIPKVWNNIISNFNFGINHAGTIASNLGSFNNFIANSSDVFGWVKDSTDIALATGFSSSDITGTNGAVSSSIITSAGKDFTALGVLAGRDFINFTAGTSFVLGMYGITAVGTTTLTLDISPGPDTVANKSYQILRGADFTPGTNLKAAAYPGVFPGGYSTGYTDTGAVQRVEPAAGGGGGPAIGTRPYTTKI